jgi:hypothetical protein
MHGPPKPKPAHCQYGDCTEPVEWKGLCNLHYHRQRRGSSMKAPRRAKALAGEPMAFIEMACSYTGDECLIWPYSTNAVGYGEIRIDGIKQYAHRIVLMRTQGPPPEGQHYAAHAPEICHQPRCVSPLHLRWASHSENMGDRVLDGTDARGEKCWNAILTRDQIRAIRVDPRPDSEIALDYGVSRRHISGIQDFRSWAWLDD